VIAPPDLRCNSLAVLSFAPMLLAGYNVDESCFDKVEVLLDFYKEVSTVRSHAERWVRSARENIDLFAKLGIKDSTVENTDQLRLRELEDTYAIGTLQVIHYGLGKWAKDFSWTNGQSEDGSCIF
jgi:hypothetical protein